MLSTIILQMLGNVEVIEEIKENNIILRKVTSSDATFFLESLREQQVNKYLSLGPLQDANHAKRLIKNYLNYWGQYAQFNYMIELNNDDSKKNPLVGSASLWNISWLHKRASIGIWLITKYWNQGIGKKALKLLKNIALTHLKLHRLEAYIAIENERSIKLFVSSGFLEEGKLEDYLNFKGKYHNALLLACIDKLF